MAQDDFENAAINFDRLYQAATIAAELVTRFGEDYWPVFERIDRELEARRSRKLRLEKFSKKSGLQKTSGVISDALQDESADRTQKGIASSA